MRIAMIGQKGVGAGEKAGGIERHVREIASRLAKAGHDVFVYARKKYHPKHPKRLYGVRLVYLPTVYSKRTEAFLHTLFSSIHAVFQRYDVVHYHGVGPATLAWIPRLFAPKTTVVVTFHAQDQFHQKWGWFARRYLALGERAAVMFSHFCISVSHDLQVYCRTTFGREVVYIPNGAEIKPVPPSDLLEKFGLAPGEYILNVGRIVPSKGLQFLIEAFKSIKTEKQLVIVGGSGFSVDYERRIRDIAAGDPRIHFLGFQADAELDQLYAHAYLYCHPSESEGLPLVILEAMSFGIMPLVSDIPSNLEAIHHAGEQFAVADVQDLRRKLEHLLKHPDYVREKAEESRAVVEVHFSWDMIASHVEGVYISARH